MLFRPCSVLLCVFIFASYADADVAVRGYMRKSGTYVAPHMRSESDGLFFNNWSTKGNINPYTGVVGSRVTPPNQLPFSSPKWSRQSLPDNRASTADINWGMSYNSSAIPSDLAARGVQCTRVNDAASAINALHNAQVSALGIAFQKSNARRRLFNLKLAAERARLEEEFESMRSTLIDERRKVDEVLILSDKEELRARYRELVKHFDERQAESYRQFLAGLADNRQRFCDEWEPRLTKADEWAFGEMLPVGQPSIATLIRDMKQAHERKLIASENQEIVQVSSAAKAEREAFLTRAKQLVREELACRSVRRATELENYISALKTAHEAATSERLARLASEFATAESERFAIDQAEAERRVEAVLHNKPNASTTATPVSYAGPSLESGTNTFNHWAAVAFVTCLGLLIALFLKKPHQDDIFPAVMHKE